MPKADNSKYDSKTTAAQINDHRSDLRERERHASWIEVYSELDCDPSIEPSEETVTVEEEVGEYAEVAQ